MKEGEIIWIKAEVKKDKHTKDGFVAIPLDPADNPIYFATIDVDSVQYKLSNEER